MNHAPNAAPVTPDSGMPRIQLDASWARWLFAALIGVIVVLCIDVVAMVSLYPEQKVRVPGVLVAITVCLAISGPLRRGEGARTLIILSYGSWIYLTVASITGGGLSAASLMAMPLGIVIPGWLLGRRAAKRFALYAACLGIFLALGSAMGWIAPAIYLQVGFHLFIYLLVVGIALIMTLFVAGTHRRRLEKVQQLNAELAAAQRIADETLNEFRTLADNLPALVMRADLNGRCAYVNQPFLDVAKLGNEQLVGRPLEQIFTADQMNALRPAIESALHSGNVTLLMPHHNNSNAMLYEVVLVRETNLTGQAIGLLALLYDVTERERLQVELRHAATHDPLTRLANRARVDDRIESALLRADRHHEIAALIVIDLDGFKPINDTHGHAAGDHLLQHVARQLQDAVRGVDMVGRIGGDEFVVIVENLKDVSVVENLANKLLTAIAQPTEFAGHTLLVGASIGIALYPEHGRSVRDLFQKADAAMYLAKHAGKNCFRLAT